MPPTRALSPCGTLGAYRRGCRCSPCVLAYRAYHRGWNGRRREAQRGERGDRGGRGGPLLEISPALCASTDPRVRAALDLAERALVFSPWLSVAELVGEAFLNPGLAPWEIAKIAGGDVDRSGRARRGVCEGLVGSSCSWGSDG